MARAAEERIEIVERCSAAPGKVYKPNSIDVEAFRNLERINCPKRCDRVRSRGPERSRSSDISGVAEGQSVSEMEGRR